MKVKNLIGKCKSAVVDFKAHWLTPKEGDYVPNKEVVLLALGSSGSSGLSNALNYISFSAGCFLVGSIYGISFTDIYICGILGMLFSYIFSPIGMVIQDNLGNPPKRTMRLINIVCIACSALAVACFFIPQQYTERIIPALPQLLGCFLINNIFSTYYSLIVYKKMSPRFGKFRPWVIVNCLPMIACLLLMSFLPFSEWNYATRLWSLQLVFLFYGTFSGFNGQKDNIANLMTPNSTERTRFMTIEQFVSAAIGGLIMVLLPFLTVLTGGMTGINTYRYIIPACVLLFSPLVMIQAFGLKERVILEKEHKTNVNMTNGFKQVLKNKYLWITNISGLLGNVSAGIITVLTVMVVYSMRQDYILGILTAVSGVFATPGLLLVPFLTKKFGKRKTMIWSRMLQFIAYGVQFIGLILMNNVWVLFIGLNLIHFFNIVTWMTNKLMTPDIWDYQQYISGERLEGCSGVFGLITNPLSKVLALIIPAIYTAVGFTSDWTVLYFEDVRNKVFLYTIIMSVAAHLLTTIPFFFYDLSEKKHDDIIKELQRRAEELNRINSGEELELVEEVAASDDMARALVGDMYAGDFKKKMKREKLSRAEKKAAKLAEKENKGE